jgi:hypothetical protein
VRGSFTGGPAARQYPAASEGYQRRAFAAVEIQVTGMSFSTALRLLCAASAGLPAAPALAQSAMPLRNFIVPHRAVYDIGLARTETGSGVTSADGRMVFEVTGSACEGYRMRQRMVVNIGDEEGNLGLLDFRISTFESAAGDLYNFDSRTTFNADVVESVSGEARRLGTEVEVKLKQPSEKVLKFNRDTLFPSQHLHSILDAALADRPLVSAQIYEGAGSGEKSDAATAAIGGADRNGPAGPLRTGVRHWPVSVGYFDGVEKENEEDLGEEMPAYQMQFTLYENGVTNDLVMDYGNYALSGTIESIEPLKSSDCALP